MRLATTAFVLLCLLAPLARAQDTAQRRVVLTSGRTFVGLVQDERADPLVLVGSDGLRREFPRADVVEVGPLIRGRFFRTDPVRTRHLFLPTARTIGGSTARVGLAPYPEVVYGVSDRVDLNATGYLLATSSDFGISPLVGVKATVVEQPGLAVALGASAIATFGGQTTYYDIDPNGTPILREEGGTDFLAVPYAVATFGDATRSATLAIGGLLGRFGDGVGSNEVADGVVVGVGGELQVTNGVKLFAEAYVPFGAGDSGLLVIPGVRFFGDRFSFDVVGFLATDFNETIGFVPIPARVSYTF